MDTLSDLLEQCYKNNNEENENETEINHETGERGWYCYGGFVSENETPPNWDGRLQ